MDDNAPVVEPTTSNNIVVSIERVTVSGECDSNLGFEIESNGDLDGDQAGI